MVLVEDPPLHVINITGPVTQHSESHPLCARTALNLKQSTQTRLRVRLSRNGKCHSIAMQHTTQSGLKDK